MAKSTKKPLLIILTVLIISVFTVLFLSSCTSTDDLYPEPSPDSYFKFTLSSDGASYSVKAANTYTKGNIVIPSTYKDLPVTSIGKSAFEGCSKLKSVVIPNSVTTIGGYAFSHCTSLTSIEIPNSLTRIGGNAFYWCTNLMSITIPNGVTTIDGYAFANCTSLTSITIPNSLTSIGEGVFYNCQRLKNQNITYTGTMAQWKAISKAYEWDRYSPSFTIHCTDGDISK